MHDEASARTSPAHLLALLLCAALASACAAGARRGAPTGGTPVATQRFAPDPALQRLVDPYPAPSGPSWLGGDVASSIRLSDDRYVWLFGDTLLGTVSNHCADGAAYCERDVTDLPRDFINNSIGVATRAPDGRFQPMVKYWRTERGKPAPIFAAARRGEFLWPLAAAAVDGQLLFAMSRHSYKSGLASYGNDLMRVRNPTAPPDRWAYTRHPLPNVVPSAGAGPDVVPLSWATALVRRGAHLYILGQRGKNALESTTVISRVRIADALGRNWRPAPEYLLDLPDGRRVWSRRFAADRLYAIGLPGTSEATVDYAPGTGWYSYQIAPLSHDIRLFTARDLLGPWTYRGIVYSLPPPWSTAQSCTKPSGASKPPASKPGGPAADPAATGGKPQCTPMYAAYAVKSHPELAPPDRRVLTYNVNVMSGNLAEAESALENVRGFYVPQVVAGSPSPGAGAAATAAPH